MLAHDLLPPSITSTSHLVPIKASSLNLGMKRPPNTTLNVSLVKTLLNVKLTEINDAIEEMLKEHGKEGALGLK